MDTTRAVIYTRVSSDPKATLRSTAEQETECRSWVGQHGWDLAGVFTDNDRSASRYSKKDRPDWQRLTDRLATGDVDVLVVWEISRATRDRLVWAALVEVCVDQRVKLCVGGRLYDLEDPDDAFALDLTSSMSVRESSVTRKRVMRAMAANATAGRPHGRLTYGYERVYDESSGRLLEQVVREDQAAVVREAAERVLAGETPYAIAQDFNARNVPTPRPDRPARDEHGNLVTDDGRVVRVPTSGRWDLSQIKATVTNPAYIGKRVHRGEIVGDAVWPPILDEATFYAVRSKLTDPRRRTQRDSAVRHLLSGIATCGPCGGRIRVQKNRSHLAYLCVDGFHVSRKEAWVDGMVERVVVGILSRPDLTDLFDVEDPDATAARAEAAEKRARLEGFYDAAAAGELTPQALARIESRLLPEVEAADRRARRVSVSPAVRAAAGPDAAARWDGLPLTVKRELISALVTVRILPAGRGKRVFDPATVEVMPRS